jgi:hypothetical protein
MIIIIIIINVKVQNIEYENNITCTVHCNHRRAATTDTLETCKYPAKGDNKYNNNNNNNNLLKRLTEQQI